MIASMDMDLVPDEGAVEELGYQDPDGTYGAGSSRPFGAGSVGVAAAQQFAVSARGSWRRRTRGRRCRRTASRARSGQVSFGLSVCRWRTASWWRSARSSAPSGLTGGLTAVLTRRDQHG